MTMHTEFEDRRIKKPFLGGWRNRINGTEYVNATSQTGPHKKDIENDQQCSHETQTFETRDQVVQPSYDRATQTWRPDCYVPNVSDKYISASPYETFEEMQSRLNIDGCVRTIQKYYRAYRLIKYAKECANTYRQALTGCKILEEELNLLYRRRYQQELFRQCNPRTRADFDILYNLIDNWRSSCSNRIKAQYFNASQRTESGKILEKTIRMLNDVDKHRQRIANAHGEKKLLQFLISNCNSIQWNGYKGKPIEMISMKVQKAREYNAIYESLRNLDVNVEERMETLLLLRNSLKQHNCQPTMELLYLLDQEIMLLSRGNKRFAYGNLRKRVKNAYLYFVSESQTCVCISTEDIRDEELREPLETNRQFCRSCTRLLPYRRFSAQVRTKRVPYCTSCSWLRGSKVPRINYDPYTCLLSRIRADEHRRNCSSSLAFVIRESCIYHLINDIWHGHSVISENADLFALRLIRFYVDEEWSPWNCILLTELEADTHYHIEDLRSTYSEHLMRNIFLAHQVAKSQFHDLIAVERNYRESGRYYMVQDRKDYKAPKTIENYDPVYCVNDSIGFLK
ncbi:IQ and ubiquitin-like domain-containing protein [Cephus cinctus]|uniref:IQ and ubiquitin-like domain-containing protein n=1 Tax=Cephus cinctus TaxID=211228 RepID=A0AAJ7CDP0_CEPCN|nr:IQ and ubiquitin-like domain-containing protein [Cephus cinctus]